MFKTVQSPPNQQFFETRYRTGVCFGVMDSATASDDAEGSNPLPSRVQARAPQYRIPPHVMCKSSPTSVRGGKA